MVVGGVIFKSDDVVIKSPNDRRLYRYIQLENGLCALIVHDPEIYPDGPLEPSQALANTGDEEEEEEEADDGDEGDEEGEYSEDGEDEEEGEEEEEEEGEDDESEGKDKRKKSVSQTKKVIQMIFNFHFVVFLAVSVIVSITIYLKASVRIV